MSTRLLDDLFSVSRSVIAYKLLPTYPIRVARRKPDRSKQFSFLSLTRVNKFYGKLCFISFQKKSEKLVVSFKKFGASTECAINVTMKDPVNLTRREKFTSK